MRKKKQASTKKFRGNRRTVPLPAPSLSRRAARTIVVPAAEPNHYLELADIALGSETGTRSNHKEKRKS